MEDKKRFLEDVKSDEELIEFLADGDKTEDSKRKYVDRIGPYCLFYQMKPSELLEEADEDEKNIELSKRKRRIKKKLINYREHLKSDKKYAPKTIRDHMTTIRSFYRFHDVQLPTMNNGMKKLHVLNSDEYIPDSETIKNSLKYANKKYRAIITLGASSGMGRAEIRNLKYDDFICAIKDHIEIPKNKLFDIDWITNELDPFDDCILIWTPFRIKMRIQYITFSTPESLRYILEYLRERSKNPKRAVKSLDDYLFISYKNIKNPTGQLTQGAISRYFNELNEKMELGINLKQEKEGIKKPHAFFTTHQLRRYFATTLDGLIPHRKIDEMLGHTKGQIEGAYFKTKKNELLEYYKQAIEVLTFDKPEIIDRTDEKIGELEEKIKAKDNEIEAMKNRQEILERMVKKLMVEQLD